MIDPYDMIALLESEVQSKTRDIRELEEKYSKLFQEVYPLKEELRAYKAYYKYLDRYYEKAKQKLEGK
jgi:chromosome segregation ATPase